MSEQLATTQITISVQGAALVLAWLAIVVVALAVAALLRQVRELRAVVIDGFGTSFLTGSAPRQLWPSGGRQAILLVSDAGWLADELLTAFAELAAQNAGRAEFTILLSSRAALDGSPLSVPVVADPPAAEVLRLPWQPAVVHIDRDGSILDAAPAGSVETLSRAIGLFFGPGVASGSERVDRS